jgi:hypothetical protein
MAGPPARSEKPFNYPARAAATFEFATSRPQTLPTTTWVGRHCTDEDMTPKVDGKMRSGINRGVHE